MPPHHEQPPLRLSLLEMHKLPRHFAYRFLKGSFLTDAELPAFFAHDPTVVSPVTLRRSLNSSGGEQLEKKKEGTQILEVQDHVFERTRTVAFEAEIGRAITCTRITYMLTCFRPSSCLAF